MQCPPLSSPMARTVIRPLPVSPRHCRKSSILGIYCAPNRPAGAHDAQTPIVTGITIAGGGATRYNESENGRLEYYPEVAGTRDRLESSRRGRAGAPTEDGWTPSPI